MRTAGVYIAAFFLIALLLGTMIIAALFEMQEHYATKDACKNAGGIPLTDGSQFQACLDPSVTIKFNK